MRQSDIINDQTVDKMCQDKILCSRTMIGKPENMVFIIQLASVIISFHCCPNDNIMLPRDSLALFK